MKPSARARRRAPDRRRRHCPASRADPRSARCPRRRCEPCAAVARRRRRRIGPLRAGGRGEPGLCCRFLRAGDEFDQRRRPDPEADRLQQLIVARRPDRRPATSPASSIQGVEGGARDAAPRSRRSPRGRRRTAPRRAFRRRRLLASAIKATAAPPRGAESVSSRPPRARDMPAVEAARGLTTRARPFAMRPSRRRRTARRRGGVTPLRRRSASRRRGGSRCATR